MKYFLGSSNLYLILIAAALVLYACGAQTTSTPTDAPDPSAAIPAEAESASDAKAGSDIKIELPEGDLERGKNVAQLRGCTDCHVDSPLASQFESHDDLPNIMKRGEIRMADPAYSGNASTNQEYIIESILQPEIYMVEGEWYEFMTPDFGKLLTRQDLADLMVWMSSFE